VAQGVTTISTGSLAVVDIGIPDERQYRVGVELGFARGLVGKVSLKSGLISRRQFRLFAKFHLLLGRIPQPTADAAPLALAIEVFGFILGGSRTNYRARMSTALESFDSTRCLSLNSPYVRSHLLTDVNER
jgi:hypothetical protein